MTKGKSVASFSVLRCGMLMLANDCQQFMVA
jgi:hypothetical protein